MAQISKHWALKSRITVREAALFICGHDPIDNRFMEQRDMEEVSIVADALISELQLSAEWITGDDLLLTKFGINERFQSPENADWDTAILHTGAKEWAESKGYEWPIDLRKPEAKKSFDTSKYPNELQAAIHAFEALKDTKGSNSPKQRITDWLESNKAKYGNLSVKAIERISTVANWKSEGGTPKAGG